MCVFLLLLLFAADYHFFCYVASIVHIVYTAVMSPFSFLRINFIETQKYPTYKSDLYISLHMNFVAG